MTDARGRMTEARGQRPDDWNGEGGMRKAEKLLGTRRRALSSRLKPVIPKINLEPLTFGLKPFFYAA